MIAKVSPVSIFQAERLLVKLFDVKLIPKTFCREMHNRLLRLTSTACDEFKAIVEEINEEIRR